MRFASEANRNQQNHHLTRADSCKGRKIMESYAISHRIVQASVYNKLNRLPTSAICHPYLSSQCLSVWKKEKLWKILSEQHWIWNSWNCYFLFSLLYKTLTILRIFSYHWNNIANDSTRPSAYPVCGIQSWTLLAGMDLRPRHLHLQPQLCCQSCNDCEWLDKCWDRRTSFLCSAQLRYPFWDCSDCFDNRPLLQGSVHRCCRQRHRQQWQSCS